MENLELSMDGTSENIVLFVSIFVAASHSFIPLLSYPSPPLLHKQTERQGNVTENEEGRRKTEVSFLLEVSLVIASGNA